MKYARTGTAFDKRANRRKPPQRRGLAPMRCGGFELATVVGVTRPSSPREGLSLALPRLARRPFGSLDLVRTDHGHLVIFRDTNRLQLRSHEHEVVG